MINMYILLLLFEYSYVDETIIIINIMYLLL